ncbi:MAG: S8 family serine peptidase [Fidelibacterota bacterium]
MGCSYTGSAFDIGIVDTAVDSLHPALQDHMFYRKHFHLDIDPSDPGWSTGRHGTHVAGIVASNDLSYRGIAYGVDAIINGNIWSESGHYPESNAMAAFDWAVSLQEIVEDAEVVNLSWGYGPAENEDTGFSRFFDAWADNFLTVGTHAVGNNFHDIEDNTMDYPGNSYNMIVVGSVNDQEDTTRQNDIISSFSSRGPTFGGRKKPDLVAPGGVAAGDTSESSGNGLEGIMSTNADWEGTDSNFVNKSGTSMAAPHVAGASILLMETGVIDPRSVKALLINTAEDELGGAPSDTNDPDHDPEGWDPVYGWGYIDLEQAFIHKNDFFEDIVYPDGSLGDFILYKGIMYDTDKATLVWHRHAEYIGDEYPTQWSDLNDIDLYLYAHETNEYIPSDWAASRIDNVEQVRGRDQLGEEVVIKVKSYDSVFEGVNYEQFSLATPENFERVNIPDVIASSEPDNPVIVNLNQQFTMTYRYNNSGDVMAHNVVVSLVAPPGLNIISGPSIDNFDLLPGGEQLVSWELEGVIAGQNDLSASSQSICYGETFTSSSEDIVYVGNTTWSGSIKITRDVNVPFDVTLTVDPQTMITFDDGTSLTVNGKLVSDGQNEQGLITYKSSSSTPSYSSWDGIRFNDLADDASSVKYCDISDANRGIYLNRASPAIENNTIQHCNYGIYVYKTIPKIQSVDITDISRRGIYVFDSNSVLGQEIGHIKDSYIRDTHTGINLYKSSPYILRNELTSNTVYGVYARIYSDPMLGNPDGTDRGCNTVDGSGTYNIYAYNFSDIFMGQVTPKIDASGDNTFINAVSYEVRGDRNCIITAENNWWGGAPDPSLFYMTNGSFIDYDPALERSPDCGQGQMAGQGSGSYSENQLIQASQYRWDASFNQSKGICNAILTNPPSLQTAKKALGILWNVYRQQGQGVVGRLQSVMQTNSQNELGAEASVILLGIKVANEDYSEATTLGNNIRQNFPGTEAHKHALFDLWMMYKHDLADVDQESQIIEEMLEYFPDDELTAEMTGNVPPTPARTAVSSPLPKEYALSQNYPNPFNPVTTIRYNLPEPSYVSLVIYDILGREVRTLLDSREDAGFKSMVWDGKDNGGNIASTGIYIYSLRVWSVKSEKMYHKTRKMVFLR